MDREAIRMMLKMYSKCKSEAELLRLDIEQYHVILKFPEMKNDYFAKKEEVDPGMPRALGGLAKSKTESEAIHNIITDEIILGWIDYAEKRLKNLEYKLKRIDIYLKAINEEARYILINKYVNLQSWSDVTDGFNSLFKTDYNAIAIKTVKDIGNKGIDYLIEFVEEQTKHYVS